jgi:hypothetical protein
MLLRNPDLVKSWRLAQLTGGGSAGQAAAGSHRDQLSGLAQLLGGGREVELSAGALGPGAHGGRRATAPPPLVALDSRAERESPPHARDQQPLRPRKRVRSLRRHR